MEKHWKGERLIKGALVAAAIALVLVDPNPSMIAELLLALAGLLK